MSPATASLAIIGIPLWMIWKRRDATPDHSGARRYLAARHNPARTTACSSALRASCPVHLKAARLPCAELGFAWWVRAYRWTAVEIWAAIASIIVPSGLVLVASGGGDRR